jgi:tetratricopeptide (TPR) repeat protein
MRTTIFAALTLALAATSAAAQPTSSHEATATAAYEAGDLETALHEFEAAYLETKRADLLYVIGRLHTERKDCTKAIEFFNRYLATKPGQTQVEAAQTEITKCQKILDAQRLVDTPPPPVDDQPPPPPPPTNGTGTTTTTVTTSTSDGGRGFMSDKLGVSLLVGGLVAEGAAVVLYVQARNAQCGDPVCTDLTYDEYLDAEDKAKKLRLTSIIVAGVGGVFLAGGVYRFATHDRRREPAVTLVPTSGGAALSFSGRF